MSVIDLVGAIRGAAAGLESDQLLGLNREMLVLRAQADDSLDSFAAFYELVHGVKLSGKHRIEIDSIYDAHKDNKISLIWSWRGSWKTTTITVTWTAYRIGKNPERANLIIQANDSSAVDKAASIADLIENNDGFREVFPNVVPDVGKGWGENGYEVKDISVSYTEWRAKNSARSDPTLLGLGVGSKSLIGKHPDGVLLLDDIHDEENSVSPLQRAKIVSRLKSTILPFMVEDESGNLITWASAVGTPWEEDDAYHYLKGTGECLFVNHPVMTKVDEAEIGGQGVIYYDGSEYPDLLGSWVLTWEDRWNWDMVMRWRRRTGKREFARMYLLDLEASRETGFRYMLYPSEKIDHSWRVNQGVDFGSVSERAKLTGNVKDRSYFAQLWGAKLPTGGMVIMGGKYGHFTISQGETSIMQVQNTFSNYGTCIIESDGKGEIFVDIVSRNPKMRVTPMLTRGIPKWKRHERLEYPLETGTIRISDADTPALNLLRQSLDNYPAGSLDIRDAAYWLAKAFPEVFVVPDDENDSFGKPDEGKNGNKNPLYALAKMRG